MGNIGMIYANKTDLTTTAFTAAPTRMGRKYLCLHNTHASNIIYAKFGEAATSGTGHVIKAGEKLVFDGKDCPIDYLSVYGNAASTTYSLVEGV
jgi:hypothetical protein